MEAVGYAIIDIQTLFAGFAFGFIVFCAACFVVINEAVILRRRNVMIAGAILLFGLICAPQVFQALDGTIPADYNHYRREGSLSPTEMIIMGKLFGSILGGFIGIWLFRKPDK